MLYLLTLISYALVSCAQGVSYKADELPTGKEVTLLESEEGVVVGAFSSTSNDAQQLSADGEITGTALIMPPGSLPGDTRITLELGTSLTSLNLEALGISGSVQEGSAPVVLSSSSRENPLVPMRLVLPIGLSLMFSLAGGNTENVAILYKIEDYSTGEFRDGVIPTAEITIVDGRVFFETKFFGSFQLVYTEKKITVAEVKEVVTVEPPVTKRQEIAKAAPTPTSSPPPPPASTAPPKLMVSSNNLPYTYTNYVSGSWATPSPIPITIANTTVTDTIAIGTPSYNIPQFATHGTWNGSNGTCGATLPPGQSCQIKVWYNPFTTGGEIAGVKPLSMSLPYSLSGGGTGVLNIAVGTMTVLKGAPNKVCILGPGESFSPGNCPTIPLTLPSVATQSITMVLTDYGGNQLSLGTPESTKLAASDPDTQKVNVTFNTSGVATGQIVLETVGAWNLSVDYPGIYTTPRSLTVEDVCGLPASGNSAPFHAGSGTSTDPFVICSIAELAEVDFSSTTRAASYVLAAPIAYSSSTAALSGDFSGQFNGRNLSISNLDIDAQTSSNIGFFSLLNGGVVKNLVLSDPLVLGQTNVGALAGRVIGNSIIENVTVRFSGMGKKIGHYSNSNYVGGLVGSLEDGSLVTGCGVELGTSVETRINASAVVGGLVGTQIGTSKVEKSYVKGIGIIESENSGSKIGGLVGYLNASDAILENSKVDVGPEIKAQNSGSSYIGGLVGQITAGTARDLYFGGSVDESTVASRIIGGAVGGTASSAVVHRIVMNAAGFPSSGASLGTIVGSNGSSSVCSAPGSGCVATTIGTSGKSSCGGTVCATSYDTFTPGSADFTNQFASALGATSFDLGGNNRWMMKRTGSDIPKLQWEKMAYFPQYAGTVSNDGLRITNNDVRRNIAANCKSSGKWYWEVTQLMGYYDMEIGITNTTTSQTMASLRYGNNTYSIHHLSGSFVSDYNSSIDHRFPDGVNHKYSIQELTGSTFSSISNIRGSTLGIALDLDTLTLTFYKDGQLLKHQGEASAGPIHTNLVSGQTYCAAIGKGAASSDPHSYQINFGSKPFQYGPPDTTFLPYNFLK